MTLYVAKIHIGAFFPMFFKKSKDNITFQKRARKRIKGKALRRVYPKWRWWPNLAPPLSATFCLPVVWPVWRWNTSAPSLKAQTKVLQVLHRIVESPLRESLIFGSVVRLHVTVSLKRVLFETTECTEIIMGASVACLDVELCSTWRLIFGKGGAGGAPLFWQWTQKRFLLPNYPSDLNQIWYETSGQCGVVRLCSSQHSAPLKML